ncbi:TonB-dependent hemoglobin/transferrin/lactoferrin family receptor [Pseudoalteromonas luteoviolacea]|uniref:TonB-dependent hemoglobin/transferrin/lactoferrin family receptor n=1 Tax=Pseudoalteromonas luteoviolacea TaxID=43657 RepID=UPI001B35B668|nr:TonB-dependent hemoglobin/transferrin/lactoferrin family receptor [Pseudoalteromonas luteoviolacea]MBQ4836168.1 TonB-dependent hemoglobin/transferrin/lactoferrin family receptor [Pseudoalteromonas luteoviolacea]
MFKRTTLSLGIAAAVFTAPNVVAEQFEKDSEVIVVSGSRIEQKLEDVAGTVNVVTEQEIERELAVDLNTAFKYQTGITTTGSTGEAQALNIRGIGGNRVVYVKDGRRLNDAYAGGGGLLIGRGYFDVDNVKQIEVAKGAASSLYGSDALGGIVVISTKNPSDYLSGNDTYAQVGLGYYGVNAEKSATATFAKQLSNSNATSIQVTRRDGEETQNYAEDLPGFDYTSNALLLKSEFIITDNERILATVDYFDQDVEQIVTENAYETRDDNESISFSLEFDTASATSFYDNLSAQVYYTDFEQLSDQIRANDGSRSRTGPYTDFNDYRFEQSIFGTRLVLDKQLEFGSLSHQLVYGFDYDSYETARPRYKTRIDTQGNKTLDREGQKTFPGADTTMLGLFVQDNITLIPDTLKLNAGLRIDRYEMDAKQSELYAGTEFGDISETALSPKLGVVYSVSENLNVVAQYSRGFKIPPHDLAYQSHGVEPFYQILPNSELDPETSDSVEFGVKGDFESKQFSVTVFNSKFDDFISNKIVRVEPSQIPGMPPKTYYQYQNIAEVEIKGLEADFTIWVNDNVSFNSGFSYVQGKDKETNDYISTISPLNGFVKARYELDNWSVTAAFKAAKRMTKVPADDKVKTAGWGTVDLFAEYDFGNFRLNAGVFNLLDKEYTPYESVAGQSADAALGQYTQPGRNFALNAKYTF